MPFEAIATDFDGTIAHDGHVDDVTLAALQSARRAGLRLILVTGRELSDLSNTFPHLAIFDRVVAENGALLFDPKTEAVRVLAPPPPPALVDWLAQRSVPVSIGHSIVATGALHESEVRQAIRELGLERHIVLNKGSLMVLPSDVDKATGLMSALDELAITPARTIGIGDAENDVALLNACGLAVAVANALDSVKEVADIVTANERGHGVAELLDRLRNGEFDTHDQRR